MAVENKYVDPDIVAEKKSNAAFTHGADSFLAVTTFETAAADDDGSIYRLFKDVPADLIPVRCEIYTDGITGGSDWDLGLYEPLNDGVGGTVIDKDKFADGVDLSSAAGRGSPVDGLQAIGIEEVQERIYELAGHTQENKKLGYDIALTANTVGSGAATISVLMWFVQG